MICGKSSDRLEADLPDSLSKIKAATDIGLSTAENPHPARRLLSVPKRLPKTVYASMILALSFAAPVAAGPLEDADAADRRGEFATAFPIYRALADRGVVAAEKRLGTFYELGLGVKQDSLEAAKWYSKAAEAGDESAAGSLSGIGRHWRLMNHHQMNPIIYDMVEKAAKKGFLVAQWSLGVMNYPLGDSLFKAEEGNIVDALIWYRRAAEQGDVDSQSSLGIAYEQGNGVPQDFVEAHKWYNLAAAGVPKEKLYADVRADLMERRDAVALKMTPAQIAEAQKLAREWKPNTGR